jgi:hypothetical protein
MQVGSPALDPCWPRRAPASASWGPSTRTCKPVPVHDHTPTPFDLRLSAAFDAWSQARSELAHLGSQVAPRTGQLAASPEAAELFATISRQEARCTQLWGEVVEIGQERTRWREALHGAKAPGQTQGGIEGPRRAFDAWAHAERQAQVLERELLALVQRGSSRTSELLSDVRERRRTAHALLADALGEIKSLAASLGHRRLARPGSAPDHVDSRP